MTVPLLVNLTGDQRFPHNGDVTTNVTIAAPTTWTEANYPGRVVALNRLDVDAALTLQGGPWWIMVETLDFGASGSISGNGTAGGATVTFDADYARGGTAVNTGRAQGGCGGVMIFIAANAITGTASRPISADGGAGYRDTTNAGASTHIGGQGAFSRTADNSGVAELWDGSSVGTDTLRTYLHPFAQLLGAGSGASAGGGRGGGSGQGISWGAGGSGIGGGGDSANGLAATLPIVSEPSPVALIELALAGCLGGGGGGAHVNTTGTVNSAGGGGGGCVVVWVKTLTSTPTLSASGGAAAAGTGTAGAAGVAYLIDIP